MTLAIETPLNWFGITVKQVTQFSSIKFEYTWTIVDLQIEKHIYVDETALQVQFHSSFDKFQ